MIKKNVAGQKIYIFAWDGLASGPKTGDTANISVRISKDGGASAACANSVSELDATNHPGVYVLTLSQAETNCDAFAITPSSLTDYVNFNQTDTIFYTFDQSALTDKLDRLLGLSHENIYIDNTLYDSKGNLTSARLRIYSVAASVGTASDVTATYTITCVGSKAGQFTTWQQVKD
jgi:hypothetical protein